MLSDYLRPLKLNLRDTEIYMPGQTSLCFFCRPIGSAFSESKELKTGVDTSLHRPRRIDEGTEFSILGFNLFVEESATDDQKRAILDNGLFNFYLNSDLLAYIHLIEMPRRMREPDVMDILCIAHRNPRWFGIKESDLPKMTLGDLHKACELWMESDARRPMPHYPFNVGRAAFKMKDKDDFYVEIKWNKAPEVKKPLRLIALVTGLHWKSVEPKI